MISALPLLLVGAIDSAVLVRPEDYCSGACPASGADWSTPFNAMLQSAECAPSGDDDISCTALLSSKVYYLPNGIELCRPIHLKGYGTIHGDAASVIQCGPNAVPCIETPDWTSSGGGSQNCSCSGVPAGAGAKLEDLRIECSSGSNAANHGVLAAGQFVMEDVYIANVPGDGVRISTGSTGGNQALARMQRVQIHSSGRIGLNVMDPNNGGNNANQMVFDNVSVVSACRLASE